MTETRTRAGAGARVRVGIGVGAALGIERGVSAKVEAEIAGQFDEIGAGVDPVLEIRDGDEAGGVDVGVGALDDHVARGIHVDAGRVAGVGLHKPDDDGDVVGEALEGHGNGAVCLEEVDGTAVVVGERRRFGLERGVVGGESDEVLADEPLGVLGIRERGGATLGEDGA